MHLRVVIVAAACAAPAPLPAAEPASLPTVVVTATRSEQDDVRLPASVRVITAAEIAASGAQHLVDALRLAGNLQVTDFYGDGARAQIDARAFGDAANANTLVLVDGRRLNNPDIAAPDLNGIALKDVERIEIIEGSAGALYGDQATGGVINIVTRAPHAPALTAEVASGSFGARGARAAVSHAGGGATARLSAEHRGSDNFRAHNHVEYRNVLGHAGYDWGNGGAFAEVGAIEEDLETPGTLFPDEVAQDRRQSTASFRGDYADTDTGLARAGLHQGVGGSWLLRIEYTRRDSDAVFRLGSAAFGPATQDAFQARDVRSMNPQVSGGVGLFGREVLVTAGADLQRSDYLLRSQFGTQTNVQRQADGYAQAIVPLPRGIDVTAGARRARVANTVQDGFTFTAPTAFADDATAAQLGLAWRHAELRLFARTDRHYRYPKVDEFTFTEAMFGSNRNVLQTQTGTTLEAGGEWSGAALTLAAAAFRLDNEQEIAFDPTGGPFGFGANVNLPSTRRDGVQARGRWQVAETLEIAAGGQYVDARITGGTALAGRDVPLAAAKLAHATATAKLPARVGAQLGIGYTGRRALAADFDNSLPPLPSHTTVHAALTWRWHGLALAARADNLLDRAYSEYGAAGLDPAFNETPALLPSPGRRYALIARLDL